ncbi:AAA domain [Carpediemonas membranifera]|uniref:AAA domain n=1 Tax=Carpediemonas membranifera TaxID=201153 RepID=A0A8J6B018_9EUKA|nr:AAA domain [Carpediemonas membranifera]|eukprot:KAG9396410.1 AAA domain [Carpediemonas membranifera]
MIVICLEGAHGVGKSTVIEQLQKLGVNVLDEAFIGMPSYNIHPQSLCMESIWLSHWFERLLKLQQTNPDDLFVCDRSPYCAELYTAKGRYGAVLEPFIRAQIEELKASAGIEIYTVNITVERQTLWDRIQARLALEPHRQQFNEDSYEWLTTVLDWYEAHRWDFSVENSRSQSDKADAVMDVIKGMLGQIHKSVPAFRAYAASPECRIEWREKNGIQFRL